MQCQTFDIFKTMAIKNHVTFNKLNATLELNFTMQNYKHSSFKSIAKYVINFCPTIIYSSQF